MWFYCTAQGTISNLLGENMMEDSVRKRMCIFTYICVYTYTHMYIYIHTHIYMYMYDWVTLLYSRNWHNIVNQL